MGKHNCFLKSPKNHYIGKIPLSKITCWGSNSYGQAEIPPNPRGHVKGIALGTNYSCVTKHSLECYGYNHDGQIDTPSAYKVNILQVSAHTFHTCAIRHDHSMKCWGDNSYGRVDLKMFNYEADDLDFYLSEVNEFNGDINIELNEDIKIELNEDINIELNDKGNNKDLMDFDDVLSQINEVKGIKSDYDGFKMDSLYGDSVNSENHLNNLSGFETEVNSESRNTPMNKNTPKSMSSTNSRSPTPSPLQTHTNVSSVSLGLTHSCVIESISEYLNCWGKNTFGQTQVPLLYKYGAVNITAGMYHTCAIDTDRVVECWGLHMYGLSHVPIGIKSLRVDNMDCGSKHCCVSTQGHGSKGYANGIHSFSNGKKLDTIKNINLEDEDKEKEKFNQKLPGRYTNSVDNKLTLSKPTSICWGKCLNGECDVPFIVEDSGILVSTGDTHSCIYDENGIISCFGSNDYGQLTVPITAYNNLI